MIRVGGLQFAAIAAMIKVCVCFLVWFEFSTCQGNNVTEDIATTHGNSLESYRWVSLIDSQVPEISNDCNQIIQDCLAYIISLDNLFNDSRGRKNICARKEDPGYCLNKLVDDQKNITNDGPNCPLAHFDQIWKYMCHEINLDDDDTPPISFECAKRYHYCGGISYQAYRLFSLALSRKEKSEICNDLFKCIPTLSQLAFNDKPKYCDKEEGIELINYFCSPDGRSIFPKIGTKCVSAIPMCENEGFFELLVSLKSFPDQYYMCHHLEECLVLSQDCSHVKAEVSMEFLCNETGFTPDVYGLYRVSNECMRDFRRNCVSGILSPIISQWNTSTRSEHCLRRMVFDGGPRIDDCQHLPYCTFEEDTVIGNYLCFDPDNTILKVSQDCAEQCRDRLATKYNEIDFSRYSKGMKDEICQLISNNFCMQCALNMCTSNEHGYIYNFMCNNYIDQRYNIVNLIVLPFVAMLTQCHRLNQE